jgi:hypothetical protein
MWDTAETGAESLSHDLPCPWCGHAGHLYLPCDAGCGCQASMMPGGTRPR